MLTLEFYQRNSQNSQEFFQKNTSKDPLQVPGVYCLQYGERYYVGMATNLQKRLDWHMRAFYGDVVTGGGVSRKYWAVVNKSAEPPKVFILECDEKCANSIVRSGLERMWILLFWKKIGAAIINTMFVPDIQRKAKKRGVSRNTRLERSIRMSETIRNAHKDPDYKKKMRAIAVENWKNVPDDKRALLNEDFGKRVKSYYQINENREKKSAQTSRQWKDPEFKRINRERLEKLRSTGWKPTPSAVIRVALPDGTSHLLLQSSFVSLLNLGGRVGGPREVFERNPMLSDWTVRKIGDIAGHLRMSRQDEFDRNFEAFKCNPFIRWIVRHKEKYPKILALKPVRFCLEGEEYRVISKTLVKKAGSLKVDGAHAIEHFETLFQFAASKLPIYPHL